MACRALCARVQRHCMSGEGFREAEGSDAERVAVNSCKSARSGSILVREEERVDRYVCSCWTPAASTPSAGGRSTSGPVPAILFEKRRRK